MLRFLLVASVLFPSSTASAQDVWTDPFPGIRYLHRSTDEPKEIHALIVDLSRPEIFLRATKDNEKGRTTTSFSNLVGAAAAVNGDFYNTNGSYDPVGLAIGDGSVWSNDPADHNFIACTAAKACEIDINSGARTPDPNWLSAVGGNVILVNGGAIAQSANDDSNCGDFCTVQHPRTAVGLSADRMTLILVVVEGRQTPILGMTLNRLAQLMLELGSDVAMNLDGGGSSAMVVGGTRVSGRPTNEPAERTVSNHLAVIFDQAAATSGRLVGFVRENDIFDANAGLGGASVTLSTGENTTTDAQGFYEFPEVTPGVVTVSVELDGFLPASDTKDVAAGITNWKSIAMMRGVPDAGMPEPPDAGMMMETPDAGEAIDGGEQPVPPLPEDAGVTPPMKEEPMVEEEPQADPGCTCVLADRTSPWLALLFVAIVLRRRK